MYFKGHYEKNEKLSHNIGKISVITQLIKLQYPEYRKNSYNSTIKRPITKILNKGFEQLFLQRVNIKMIYKFKAFWNQIVGIDVYLCEYTKKH